VVSRKMLIAGVTLAMFLLVAGIGAAQMVVQGELESVLAERLVEAGLDPTSEDVAKATQTVLVELKEEYADTEHLLSVLKEDPNIIIRISVLLESEVDESGSEPIDEETEEPVGEPLPEDDGETQDPIDTEEPLEDGDLPPEDDLEEPAEEDNEVDEENDQEKRAPRERAIERLQEHLERGLPV
jgi:hypothetical protein